MAKSQKINVMLSSRCKTRISYQGKSVWLSEIRQILQEEIESVRLWDDQQPLFECWINETSSGADIAETWWEESIKRSSEADIVIVFYNGEAGGGIKNGPLGICEAELNAVLTNSKKVRIIRLPLASPSKDKAQRTRDEKFQEFVRNLDSFTSDAETGQELIDTVRQEIRDIVVALVQNAAITPDLSKSNIGAALQWHRMSYAARETAMREQLWQDLLSIGGTKPSKLKSAESELTTIWLTLGGKRVLAALHAVPAALSQPAAREIVGQPFLMDHALHEQLMDGDGGPLHIVACYKSATESQALKMLGFPDATVVPGRYGLHVADSVQKIQIVLLKNCQSPHATTDAIGAWLEWVKRSAEDTEVAKRAAARKRIIAAIAKENGKGVT
jgi:hypothetical protein